MAGRSAKTAGRISIGVSACSELAHQSVKLRDRQGFSPTIGGDIGARQQFLAAQRLQRTAQHFSPLAERGGGHAGAVDLVTTSAQIAVLQSAGLFLPMPQTDHEPETEIIGDVDQLKPEEWVTVIELLSPFGRGNPFPLISITGAVCQDEPTALISQENQKVWGLKGKFTLDGGKVITVVGRDPEAARRHWTAGARCDLTLELTVQRHADRIFYNWTASSSQPSGSSRQNPEALAATGQTSFVPPRQASG